VDTPKIQVVLDSIEKARERQAFDLSVLALWAHAEDTTGMSWEDVKTFTFRPEYLTKEQATENKRRAIRRAPPVYCAKNWHNCLRLKSGDLISMPGISRPIPPGWLEASARKVTSLL
jgi:hypothetical protein